MVKTLAFIGGSGLAKGLEDLLSNVEKHENVQNKFGTVLSYYTGETADTKVVILPRHGDSITTPARSPAELVEKKGYEANIWALHELDVNAVIGFSAVGVLDRQTPLASDGSFIIPVSYIRGFAASQHSFGKDALEVHTNMGDPFNERLRRRANRAIIRAECDARRGIYIYNGGDTFETPHEIAVLESLTREFLPLDRVVGMTTVPEAILCKQMKIPFAAICSNVNYAEGLSNETLVSHEQTLDVMGKAAPYIEHIAREIIHQFDRRPL